MLKIGPAGKALCSVTSGNAQINTRQYGECTGSCWHLVVLKTPRPLGKLALLAGPAKRPRWLALLGCQAGLPNGSLPCSRCAAGTWQAGFCKYSVNGNTRTAKTDCLCGCRLATNVPPLLWKPSQLCVTGAPAAAKFPAVCYVKNPSSSSDFQIGYIVDSTCFVSAVPWGPGAALITSATGFGPNMKALCIAGGWVIGWMIGWVGGRASGWASEPLHTEAEAQKPTRRPCLR
jgi:hypothetical protein